MPIGLRALVFATILTLLCGTASLAHPAVAQTANLKTASQQELDVVKVLVKQEAAWNRGDLDAFAEGYKNSPDTLFLGRQVSRGFANMLADYHHNYPTRDSMGTLTFTDLEVHPIDEKVAVCIGRFHLERSKKAGGAADGLFSLVFEKTAEGWKIVVDHTT